MLQEISRHSINLANYEDADMVWHNNVLSVRCDNGLHLFDFSYNLKCVDKNIDFWESNIEPSTSSPATDLFPSDIIKCRMRNMHFSQLVLDPALWPHNKQLMKVAIIFAFDWSPVDFVNNNECAVAVLNSAGNIDVYKQGKLKWTKLENLSIKLKNLIVTDRMIPLPVSTGQLNVENVKNIAYELETNAICWSPELNNDKSCYFVTAQKSGIILFWQLKHQNNQIDVILQGKISENTEELVTLKWIPCTKTTFLLICSSMVGEIVGYECEIMDNVIKLLNTHSLWPHKDKMVARYIYYEFLNDNIIIAYNKHRHLLLQIIDRNCKLLAQNITNVNDNRITCVSKSQKDFYVSTINREVYLVKYAYENEALNSQLIKVEIKGIPQIYELYSVAHSANDAILALAFLDRTILCRKKPVKLEIVFYSEGNNDQELSILLNNPSKSLTHLWDVIELLRCKTLRTKVLPKHDYLKLFEESKVDIYKSKVFLIVLNFYVNLEKILQNGSKGLLPETTFTDVKDIILARHAMGVMRKYFKEDSFTDDPVAFESFVMAGIFLEGYCDKNDNKFNELLASEILDMFYKKKNELIQKCQWCNETMKGFVCPEGHTNMFCSLTFTHIKTEDYLVCKGCGVTVMSNLYINKPKCVFCDQYLCKYLTTL